MNRAIFSTWRKPAASLANSSPRKSLWLVARCVLTIGILAVLWNAAGGAEIARRLAQVSPLWLIAAMATLIVQTVLSAQRWRVTATQLGQSLPSRYATKEYFLSQAFNQVLPGAVLGDAARAVRAREQGGLMVAWQAVFFERLAGQIAMFVTLCIAFVATLAAPGGLEWPIAMHTTLSLASAAGVVASICLLALCTLPPGTAVKVPGCLRAVHKALFTRKVLPAQIGYGAVITICNLMAFGLAARSVGVELSVIEIAALVPVVLFAMLIPVSISGWGMREGAAALVLPLAGISAADSIVASIMFGIALLLSVLPGAFMVMAR